MGSTFSLCRSDHALTTEEQKTRDLDNMLQHERTAAALDFKILLLGAGESGKSTVIKQLRNIHRGKASMTKEEIESYTNVLHTNTIQSMRVLLRACESFNIEMTKDEQEAAAAVDEHDENELMTLDHAIHIDLLWRSQPIKDAIAHRHEIYFPDAAMYYFQNVFRFVELGYVPSEEDIIMARIRTTGMFMTNFDSPPVHWRIVDVGGQRSERKKWIKFFDDVQGILFVVNLAGYNQVLFEDQTKNRMNEALDLFEKIAKVPCFENTPIFLFFNKKDLFEEFLRGKNIDCCFPDYKGKPETQLALNYIAEQFERRMPKNHRVANVHFIAARYKKDVKYSFEDIKKYLVQKNQHKINKAMKSIGR
uniref:G-protein subunit alpha 8 n=2 Tax=Hirondellea gigas TaxID=1518452 RepID=A0A6A7G7U2_9CRUS